MLIGRQKWATLPLRVAIGGGIMVAGLLKFTPDGYANIVYEFEQLQVPAVQVVGLSIAVIESITGFMILVGWFMRVACLINLFSLVQVLLIGLFLGEIPAALPDFQYFPYQLPGFHLSFIMLATIIFLLQTGAGAFSVDALLQGRRERRRLKLAEATP